MKVRWGRSMEVEGRSEEGSMQFRGGVNEGQRGRSMKARGGFNEG